MVDYVLIETQNGEIHTFHGLNSLLEYVEPIDIEEDRYKAFDSRGNIVTLSVNQVDRKIFFFTIKNEDACGSVSKDNRAGELEEYITAYVNKHSIHLKSSKLTHKIGELGEI